MTDRPQELDASQLDQVSGGVGRGIGHGASTGQGSDAELDMLRLQQLMSQRQTAVQEATNLMSAMNDTTSQVAKNIGS